MEGSCAAGQGSFQLHCCWKAESQALIKIGSLFWAFSKTARGSEEPELQASTLKLPSDLPASGATRSLGLEARTPDGPKYRALNPTVAD